MGNKRNKRKGSSQPLGSRKKAQKKYQLNGNKKNKILILTTNIYESWAKDNSPSFTSSITVLVVKSNAEIIKLMKKEKVHYKAIVLAPSHGNEPDDAKDDKSMIKWGNKLEYTIDLCRLIFQLKLTEHIHLCCCFQGCFCKDLVNSIKDIVPESETVWISGYTSDIGGIDSTGLDQIEGFQFKYIREGCLVTQHPNKNFVIYSSN